MALKLGVAFVGTHGNALEFLEYRACASHKTRGAVGGVSEDCNLSFCLIPCSSQGSSSAAYAAREAFFQPKDLGWLDSCDKHRNEEIKQAAAVARISTGLSLSLSPRRSFVVSSAI
jgi:hypothetical protein